MLPGPHVRQIQVTDTGLTVVMIAAEIDLSIGSLEALSGSVAAGIVIEHGYSMWLGIAGSYRKHENVDVVYEVAGRRQVATGLRPKTYAEG